MVLKTGFLSTIAQIIMVSGLLLSGCSFTDNQVDYFSMAEQQLDLVKEWPVALSQQDQAAGRLDALINSTELAMLVKEALANNPNLKQTMLSVQSAMVDLRLANADRLPTVDADLQAVREEDVSGTDYQGAISVSWQADLWGRYANASAAASEDVASQRLLYQAAKDTLAAEVMSAWLNLIHLKCTLTIEQARLHSIEVNKEVVLGRYRKGLGSLEDLDSILTAEASSRASVESYQETLARQSRALQTLLGQPSVNNTSPAYPGAALTSAPETHSIPSEYPDVLQPLVALPEVSLQRRPDLQAAYSSILAETLRTEVAYKDLLPSINLQAALTDIATSPAEALLTDPVWSLLGQLTAPLFHGGALQGAVDKQKLSTAKAYEAYRESLLTAVEEVSNALSQEQSLAIQQQHVETALKSSENTLEQYLRKYRTGAVTILDLLSVQRSNYDLQTQLNSLIFDRLNNRITLALALGLGVTS
jgi:NodT family efflux transporter outer membrane factor (OMF) lipoprotein